MLGEELRLVFQGRRYRYLVVDLLLGSAFHAKVAQFQGVDVSLEQFDGVSAFVHEVNLRHDANGALAVRVHFSRDLNRVRVGQVRIGRRQGQDQRVWRRDELHREVSYLRFNVLRLSLDWHPCHAGEVHESQVDQFGREYCQPDWRLSNTLLVACYFLRLRHDLFSDVVKIVEFVALPMQKLAVLLEFFLLAIFVFNTLKLQYKRTARDDARATRKEVPSND